MNKPLTMIYDDFKAELTNLINNSGLPAFMLESILQNYLNEIRIIMQKQYQFDKSQYDKSLAEENANKDGG